MPPKRPARGAGKQSKPKTSGQPHVNKQPGDEQRPPAVGDDAASGAAAAEIMWRQGNEAMRDAVQDGSRGRAISLQKVRRHQLHQHRAASAGCFSPMLHGSNLCMAHLLTCGALAARAGGQPVRSLCWGWTLGVWSHGSHSADHTARHGSSPSSRRQPACLQVGRVLVCWCIMVWCVVVVPYHRHRANSTTGTGLLCVVWAAVHGAGCCAWCVVVIVRCYDHTNRTAVPRLPPARIVIYVG